MMGEILCSISYDIYIMICAVFVPRLFVCCQPEVYGPGCPVNVADLDVVADLQAFLINYGRETFKNLFTLMLSMASLEKNYGLVRK